MDAPVFQLSPVESRCMSWSHSSELTLFISIQKLPQLHGETEVLEPLYQSSHALFIGRSTELQHKQTLAAYSSSAVYATTSSDEFSFLHNHTDVCLISDAAQVVLLGLFIWPCRLSSASWDSAAKADDFYYGTTDRRMTVLIENISLYITSWSKYKG